MKTTKRILVLLLSFVLILSFAACDKTTDDTSKDTSDEISGKSDFPENRRDASARTGKNETDPLVLATLTLDGKFNPFYATSQPDVDVVKRTQLKLLTNNELAEPVSGINEYCLAYSHKMTVNEDQSKSTYEFILKNGIKFSDGSVVTGKDVLFNLYEYLDPAFTGSATLFSMDIEGLQAYRSQTLDESAVEKMSEENLEKANAVVDAYLAEEEISEEETEVIWSAVRDCLQEDSAALSKYGFTPEDFKLEQPEDYAENYSKSLILIYVGGLSYSADTQKWTLDESAGLDVNKLKDYSRDEYVDAALAYVKANMTAKEYDENFGYTTVTGGKSAVNALVKSYELAYLEENKGSVKSISGITLDKVTCDDGEEREKLTVVLNGVDPKAIWNFTFEVAPMAYYSTEELAEQANGEDAFGVEFSSTEFQEQLKKKVVPLGAGPYAAADSEGNVTTDFNEFYKDGIVNLVANDDFLLSAPLIKFLRIKTITPGSEVTSLQNGEVMVSEPSAQSETINELAGTEYKNVLVDNLGYGYIGMNAQLIPDINARKAIASAFNTDLALQYYSGGLATIIYRSMSRVSWAYPEDAENMYPFDETGKTSKDFFLASDNFKEEDGKVVNKNGTPVEYKFTLPSAADDHPAGQIFLKAKETLAKIGVDVTIEVDDNLLSKLEDNVVELWTAAWQATIDPDMYQVYYSDPAKNKSNSPKSFGLYWLFENGTDDEKDLLVKLNEAIVNGRKSLNVEERKPVYKEALDALAEICVEIPTYQRKNMFVYNSKLIDGDTLVQEVTPYKAPFDEIWNVSFVQ